MVAHTARQRWQSEAHMKKNFEEVFVIDGKKTVLCVSETSRQDRERGWPPYSANTFLLALNGDYDLVDSIFGTWRTCVQWLGRKLDKVQRIVFYQKTGIDVVHRRQSEECTRKGVAAEQYVASYLGIHYGLNLHLSNPGTPSKDLVAYKHGCERGCAIQVKYRENARTVKLSGNVNFDFLVCITPGAMLPLDDRSRLPMRYRRQLSAFIIPAEAIYGNESFRFCYSNYFENWDAITGFFE